MHTSHSSFSAQLGSLGVTLLLIGVAFCTLALLSGTTRLAWPIVVLFVGAGALLGLSCLVSGGR